MRNVLLVMAGHWLALVDERTKEFILQRPITKNIRQEIRYIIKQRGYCVQNVDQFPWVA